MKKVISAGVLLALSTSAFAIVPFKLNQIQVKGVPDNQQQDIVKLLNVKSGTIVNDDSISKIISTLYETGRFSDVQVKKDNSNLVVELAPKEIIASINFTGNSLLPTDQIRKSYEENNIRQGKVLNQEVLRQLNIEVEKFYRSQGYTQATVITKTEALADGSVNLTVIIDEKKKAYLSKLTLQGNKTFTQDQILANSPIKPGTKWYNFYTNSNFTGQDKATLMGIISSYYKDRGYAKFEITNTKEENNDAEKPENVDYTIDINEGKVYTVTSTSVFTRDTTLAPEFAKLNKIEKGSIYNQSKISQTIGAIRNYLLGLGYAKAQITPVYKYDDDKATMDVVFVIEPGNKFSVNNITFDGNYQTKDYVIRRLLRQQENSTYDLNKVNQDVTSLLRSGYFDDVSYDVKPVEGTTDQLNLAYKVKEGNNGSIQLGLGYGNSVGLSVTGAFKQKNFLGTGRDFGFDVNKSKGRFSSSLNFTEPFITTSGISLNSSLYFNTVDTTGFEKGAKYKQNVYGATVGTTIPVSQNSSVSYNIGYEYNSLTNLPREYYRGLYLKSIGQDTSGTQWEIATKNLKNSVSYNYNTYDRYLFPTKGFDFTATASLTSLVSTDNYFTTSASLKGFYPLNESGTLVLGGRLKAAHAHALGDSYLPTSALYVGGGYGTVRGLANGSLGPRSIVCTPGAKCDMNDPKTYNVLAGTIGGDTMVAGGLDFIFPVFKGDFARSVRTSAFLDTAAVWNTKWTDYASKTGVDLSKIEDYSKPTFRITGGLNVDWRSPVGPLSVSLGLPIYTQKDDQRETFSINIGSSF